MRYVEALARVRPVDLDGAGARPPLVGSTTLGTIWLGLDAGAEAAAETRVATQRAELDAAIGRLRALLANGQFTDRAPAAVVERERARLAELERQVAALEVGG